MHLCDLSQFYITQMIQKKKNGLGLDLQKQFEQESIMFRFSKRLWPQKKSSFVRRKTWHGPGCWHFVPGQGLKCLSAVSNETSSSSEQRHTPMALRVIRLGFGKQSDQTPLSLRMRARHSTAGITSSHDCLVPNFIRLQRRYHQMAAMAVVASSMAQMKTTGQMGGGWWGLWPGGVEGDRSEGEPLHGPAHLCKHSGQVTSKDSAVAPDMEHVSPTPTAGGLAVGSMQPDVHQVSQHGLLESPPTSKP